MVRIGDLRVIICREGKHYFAQGLELDYAAQGDTVSDVKKSFLKGLALTVDANIAKNGRMRIGDVAPQALWNELFTAIANARCLNNDSVACVDGLPFNHIRFFLINDESATV